jgi:hypothetical protein
MNDDVFQVCPLKLGRNLIHPLSQSCVTATFYAG